MFIRCGAPACHSQREPKAAVQCGSRIAFVVEFIVLLDRRPFGNGLHQTPAVTVTGSDDSPRSRLFIARTGSPASNDFTDASSARTVLPPLPPGACRFRDRSDQAPAFP